MDAFFVIRALAVFCIEGMAAGVAGDVFAFLEAVADGDAVVEDKAFAFPEAFFCGDVFEVFEDSAVELVDIVVAVVLSFISAYCCIHLFLKFLQKIGFMPFVYYRIVLGLVLSGFLIYQGSLLS